MIKKGMSPLLATMLLIAFAISLGILIMALGENMQGNHNEYVNASEICAPISFEILKVGDHDSICFDTNSNRIKLTGKNSGQIGIHSIKMNIIGRRSFQIELLEQPLNPNVPVEKNIDYDVETYGSIREIHFIPRVQTHYGEDPFLCYEYPTVIENIEFC